MTWIPTSQILGLLLWKKLNKSCRRCRFLLSSSGFRVKKKKRLLKAATLAFSASPRPRGVLLLTINNSYISHRCTKPLVPLSTICILVTPPTLLIFSSLSGYHWVFLSSSYFNHKCQNIPTYCNFRIATSKPSIFSTPAFLLLTLLPLLTSPEPVTDVPSFS